MMSPITRGLAAAMVALAAACGGTTGTVAVELTTAPGSQLLDSVQLLRLTITNPRQVIEAERGAGGFSIALEVDASGASGALIVEGFDGNGTLIACGQSPPFPVAAINADIVVYVAAPNSIALAPAALRAARSEVAGADLGYGVVLAGGRDASGAPSTTIAIYNAYDHTLLEGIALPAPRTGLAVAAGANGGVYLFGGTGPDGAATATLWRFDTTVAPNGGYSPLTEQPAFARTAQALVPIGPIGAERYLVTGTPPLTLAGGSLTARTDIAALPSVGTAVVASDGVTTAVFAGSDLVRFRQDAFDTLGASGRSEAGAATLPDGRVVVAGGADAASRDALVIDAATGAVTVIPGALAVARSHPSLAATSRHLVIAGGTDAAGAPIASAEVLDAHTLAPVVMLPILARTGTYAAALPNGQVLLVGGSPASEQIELFTPGPP